MTGAELIAPVYQGWGKPGASRKYHYFSASTRSVCGKWWWPDASQTGSLEDTMHEHKDNREGASD